jgi:hypothetical protein
MALWVSIYALTAGVRTDTIHFGAISNALHVCIQYEIINSAEKIAASAPRGKIQWLKVR